jgi:adenylate kinase family enzyme
VLRERVDAAIAGDAWVVDGTYRSILGDRILERADTVVWLDLPLAVVLWRLLRRTHRRIRTQEELWSGNVESGWRDALRYLIWPAAKAVFRNRRTARERFAQPHLSHLEVVRLRSPRDVTRWLSQAAST